MMLQLSERVVSERVNEIDLEACRWIVIERGPPSTATAGAALAMTGDTGAAFEGAQSPTEPLIDWSWRVPVPFQSGRYPGDSPKGHRCRAVCTPSAGAEWLGNDWFSPGMRYVRRTALRCRTDLRWSSTRPQICSSDIHVVIGIVRLARGEVLFTIAQDLARPFVVRTAEWLVRALDTSGFVVRAGDVDFTRVTVTDGTWIPEPATALPAASCTT